MKSLSGILTTLLLSLILTGCFHDDNDNAPSPNAQLRVLHGSPDAPNVDVLVNGSAVLTDVPYKAASGYLNVPAGGFDIAINATGTDTTALALSNVELVPNTPYTIIAANTVANIEAIVLNDTTIDPKTGNLMVRVVHGSAAAPAVDIYVTGPKTGLNEATPTLSNVSYKDASGFLEIAGGEYRIRVTATGSTDVIFDSGAINLAAGAKLTIVALPSENAVSPIDLVALTGDAAAPTIELGDNRAGLRAAHLSPDAPNVDVYVDGSKVLTDVPFKAISAYLLVNSGKRQLQINPTGTMTPVIDVPLDIAAMSSNTAAAVGFVASIEPLAIADDLTPPTAGNAHVRVIHASPDAPNVDIYVDGAKVLTDVPFKGVSNYLPLAAGAHTIQVNATGTSTTVIDAAVNLEDGAIYTIIAANALSAIEAVVVKDN